MSLLNVNKIAPQSGTDFTLGDSGDTFTVPSGATLTVAGTFTQTGAQTFDGGVDIDNFNINGTTITLSSGDMTLDVAGDIVLDADGADIVFKDGGTSILTMTNSSTDFVMTVATQDKDFKIVGDDGGSAITPFTLDMSAGGDLFLTGGLIDLKNDGSAVSQIKFYCESSNAHAQTLIGAPHSQSATNTLTLPDGNNGVLLSTVSTATVTNKTLTSPVLTTPKVVDNGYIQFGTDSEVRLISNPDKGVIVKHTATADDKPVTLTLQTGETDMAANDVIGKIEFQAPDEGTGTDAVLVSGAIQAVAEGDHSSSSNATRLEFMTGASEAAAVKMAIASDGDVGIGTETPLSKFHVYKFVSDATTEDLLTLETSRSDFGNTLAGGAILFKNQDGNNGTNIARIKVVTENGIIYLMGLISQEKAKEALRLTSEIGGAVKVVSVLEYTD